MADAHTWDGEEVLAILDNEKLQSKYSAEYLLETNLSLLVEIPTSEIDQPKEHEVHVFDGIRYTVWSITAGHGRVRDRTRDRRNCRWGSMVDIDLQLDRSFAKSMRKLMQPKQFMNAQKKAFRRALPQAYNAGNRVIAKTYHIKVGDVKNLSVCNTYEGIHLLRQR